MRFEIARSQKQYRGFERSLLATDLLTKKSKSCYSNLLELYFKYSEIEIQGDYDRKSFEAMLEFYKEIRKYDVPCEIIVYDEFPVVTVFEHPVVFLGVDIAHDMCESLLSDHDDSRVASLLNENGLCNTEAEINRVASLLDCGNVNWQPCYVYELKDVD